MKDVRNGIKRYFTKLAFCILEKKNVHTYIPQCTLFINIFSFANIVGGLCKDEKWRPGQA
jgi:hypothetical protein